MPVGFGFSVGDFIAALELLGTVVDALRDSGNASTSFEALAEDVEQLKFTLLRVQQVRLDPRLRDEELGIDAAATRGLLTIENFWRKVQKYEPHLYTGDKRLNIRDIFARVRWSVCKKEDVEEFRTRMQSFNTTFTILLATIQIQISQLDAQDRKVEHANTISALSCHVNTIVNTIGSVPQGVNKCIQQGVAIFDASTKTLSMLLSVFTMVQQIHEIVLSVPAQVFWRKPILLRDPFGTLRPFHLDLVTSLEHLVSILEVDLVRAECGENDKAILRNGSFGILDYKTLRAINLNLPWDKCFSAGQKVAMFMEVPARAEYEHTDLEMSPKEAWYASLAAKTAVLHFESTKFTELSVFLPQPVPIKRPQQHLMGWQNNIVYSPSVRSPCFRNLAEEKIEIQDLAREEFLLLVSRV